MEFILQPAKSAKCTCTSKSALACSVIDQTKESDSDTEFSKWKQFDWNDRIKYIVIETMVISRDVILFGTQIMETTVIYIKEQKKCLNN